MAANGLPSLMSDIRQLKMQVQRQLKRDLEQANRYFNKTFTPPSVSYAVRGVKAGVAYLERNEVRFNPVLLEENQQEFIRQVVPHELAHILVYQHFGRVQSHGKEWRMMMETVLGVPADIYHCFNTRSVQQQFTYRCACQTHQLSIRRHNAVMRNKRSYICRLCKTTLQFLEKN